MTYNGPKRFKLPQVAIVICDTLRHTHTNTNTALWTHFKVLFTLKWNGQQQTLLLEAHSTRLVLRSDLIWSTLIKIGLGLKVKNCVDVSGLSICAFWYYCFTVFREHAPTPIPSFAVLQCRQTGQHCLRYNVTPPVLSHAASFIENMNTTPIKKVSIQPDLTCLTSQPLLRS